MDTARDALRSAAFGATPGRGVFAATAAADPRDRWLAAVALGGQGHYAAAATALRGLLAQPDPLWASLAASTLASHRRQLGAHHAARRLDGLALRWAVAAAGRGPGARPDRDGADAAGARADALTGLAADALGMGRLPVARRLAAAAEEAADGGWRPAVRLCWVRAELALAAGQAAAALDPARLAVRLAEQTHAVRHVAKSQLVLAAALATAGDREPAAELLHAVARSCAEHRLASLRWPAELLLADLAAPSGAPPDGDGEHSRPGERHRQIAFAALRFVLRRADVGLRTAAESSRWVPSEGLREADSAERSSVGEIPSEICTGLCQGSTPRDR